MSELQINDSQNGMGENKVSHLPDVVRSYTYITESGLGYKQNAILIQVNQTENPNMYLVLERNVCTEEDQYQVGTLVEMYDWEVKKYDYDIKRSILYGDFLFDYFISHNFA